MDEVLKDFFHTKTCKLLVHNLGFEGKFYTYRYFMKTFDDYEGMYKAINELQFEDSQLLAFAVRNSMERPKYDLKTLAFDAFGDWDADIDVTKALEEPIGKLADYNIIDTCATWYVWNTLMAEADEGQLSFYNNVMKRMQRYFLKLILTGIPMDMEAIDEAKEQLEEHLAELKFTFYSNPIVLAATEVLHEQVAAKYNSSHKTITKSAEDFEDLLLNPNSSKQLQVLLFDIMGYEPLAFSAKTGAGKTDRATIEEFLLTETDPEAIEVLECLKGFSETAIVLNTFISSFKIDSREMTDGTYRLFGNLRVCGTQTARPTANNPNLLNAPSGSTYGKLIKKCFKAKEGFLIASSDHASLQGRTGANLTKDETLVRLYTEGIDLHGLHATRFWPDKFPDFVDTTEYYNSLKDHPVYDPIRDKGKAGTFALQFGCQTKKLASTLKIPLEEASAIYEAYHNVLYPGMAAFNDSVHQEAQKFGYITLGLGLKLQTPAINSSESWIQEEAKRSAANAKVQFWDILTILGLMDFQDKIEAEGMVGKIIPHSTIYDSVYSEIVDDVGIISWANTNQIECMEGSLKYMTDTPLVNLEAELDIGKNWKSLHTIKASTNLVELLEEIHNET